MNAQTYEILSKAVRAGNYGIACPNSLSVEVKTAGAILPSHGIPPEIARLIGTAANTNTPVTVAG